MHLKIKKQTTKINKFKEVAKSFAISFFFAAFFIFIASLCFGRKFDSLLGLMNTMSVSVKESNNDNVRLDKNKKFVSYPAYGKVFGRVKIPSVSIDLAVYHGDTLDILKYGVGHYASSFFPGEGGSVLFAAHNNYFYNLDKTDVGDLITVETIYGTFTYKVTDGKIINEYDEDSLPIKKGKDVLMLYTCYPPNAVGHTPLRYVVYSELVGEDYDDV